VNQKINRHCQAIACYLKDHPKEAKFWKQNHTVWCRTIKPQAATASKVWEPNLKEKEKEKEKAQECRGGGEGFLVVGPSKGGAAALSSILPSCPQEVDAAASCLQRCPLLPLFLVPCKSA